MSEGEARRWDRASLEVAYRRARRGRPSHSFATPPVVAVPAGAREVITLADGRAAQWWSTDFYIVGREFMHRREVERFK